MKKALDLKGFNEVRSYLYGDRKATQFGGKAVGMPDFAGYALGYFVVQAYMEKTGDDIVETTFTPVDDIIRESRILRLKAISRHGPAAFLFCVSSRCPGRARSISPHSQAS